MNEKKKQEIPMPFKFDDFFTTQEQRDDAVKEKMNDPKVQETVDRLKDGAKDVAGKATEQLKKLFKKEEAAEETKE